MHATLWQLRTFIDQDGSAHSQSARPPDGQSLAQCLRLDSGLFEHITEMNGVCRAGFITPRMVAG
jgi:hypothetical protein